MQEDRFFTALGVVVAALVGINLHPAFISEDITWLAAIMGKLTGLFVVISFSWLINALLDTLSHLYGRNPNIPIKGLVQAVKKRCSRIALNHLSECNLATSLLK